MYNDALELAESNSDRKLLLYRELLKAYNKQEQLTGHKQLSLYFFGRELETIDHLLYYLYGKDINKDEAL